MRLDLAMRNGRFFEPLRDHFSRTSARATNACLRLLQDALVTSDSFVVTLEVPDSEESTIENSPKEFHLCHLEGLCRRMTDPSFLQ